MGTVVYGAPFGKKPQKVLAKVLETDPSDRNYEIKKTEALRVASRIEEVVYHSIQEMQRLQGEDSFQSSLELSLEIAGQMPPDELIDVIIESAKEGADERWNNRPLRYFSLACVMKTQVNRGLI